MMENTQQGTMLIADITGYTQYLSESELNHAREVLKTLLELLISHTKPPLIISRLAGDAVISYGLQGRMLSGQSFVEMIENTYLAFRRAIDLMVLNTTCACNACKNINNLDLKFFVHYGTFGIDRLGGHDEMVGADVIVLHRLLKNHVTEKLGIRAYTLYSDAAIQALGIVGFCEKLVAHQEEYEHLGVINVWVQDMHPLWNLKRETKKIEIPLEQIIFQYVLDFPLPREVMWDYVTLMEYRAMLTGANFREIRNRSAGRITPGSIYRCYHGGNMYTNQTVIEWQPFEYYTTENQSPAPKTTFLARIELTPIENGTRVTTTFTKANGPAILHSISDIISTMILKGLIKQLETTLKNQIEKEMSEEKLTIPQPVKIPADQIYQEAVASLNAM